MFLPEREEEARNVEGHIESQFRLERESPAYYEQTECEKRF